MKTKNIRNGIKFVFSVLVLVLFMIWSLTPIAWNVLTSLKQRVDIFTSPPKLFFEPTFEYYGHALGSSSTSVYSNLKNSLIVACGTAVLALSFSTMAAYALSRYRFRGRRQVMFMILASRLLPPISAVVPLFMMMNSLGLIDTYWVLLLILGALNIPFSTWLLKSFIDTVPKDIEESAQVEGCSTLQALWHVTMPLVAPGLAATAIFVFVLTWNEFVFAFIFTSVDVRTMPVLLSEARGADQFFWQDMAAQSTILMVPVLLLALYLQRYLVKGLTAGAIK
jgi:multiple sugar transport system permease protein